MRQDKSKTDKEKITNLVNYLSDLIDNSDLSQTEVAKALTDNEREYTQTYISLLKSGSTKIPLYLVPKLADLFEVDQAEFLMQAFEAYHPEIHKAIEDCFPENLGKDEVQILEIWREAKGNRSKNRKRLSLIECAKLSGFLEALSS